MTIVSELSPQPEIWKVLLNEGLESRILPVTLAALIFLRWADFHEAEQEAIAAFDDTDYRPVLPSLLHWRTWHLLPPSDLKTFFSDRLPHALDQLNNSRHISLATHLHRIASAVKNLGQLTPRALDALIHWLADQPFETPRDRSALLKDFDKLLLLSIKGREGGIRPYLIPHNIAALVAALAAPVAGERIYDPCFGSAGLLTAACDNLLFKDTGQFSRSGSTTLDISGVEINLDAYIVGLTRLTLAGVDDPQIELGNSLERTPSNNPQRDGFDVVLANPPWGWKAPHSKEDRWGLQHFSFFTSEGSGLFVQHAIQQLRPNGRAVIIVPEGLLFRGGADQQLRRFLIKNHSVEAIISLPETTFLPYSAIKSNILVLRRGGSTKRIRMIDAKLFFEKSRGRQPATIRHAMAEELAGWLRSNRPGKYYWDIDSDTLSEIDWDFTPKRRDQSGLIGILNAFRSEVDVIPLKECGHILAGRAIKSSNLVDTPEGDSPIPYVRIKDVHRGQAAKGSSWLSQDAVTSVDSRWKLRAGDVLLSKSGTIGKVGVVRNGAVGALAASGLYVLRPDQNRLDPHFLTAYLNSSECRVWLEDKGRGTTIRHLSRRILDEMPVPLPPLQIQHRVASQYRELGTDALDLLVLLLSGTEKDPITKWVNTAWQKLAAEWKTKSEKTDFSVIERLVSELNSIRNEEAHRSWSNNPLHEWVLSFNDALAPLSEVSKIPSGSALLSLLNESYYRTLEAEKEIRDDIPIAPQARELTRHISDWLKQARKNLSSETKITFSVDRSIIRSGEMAEIQIEVHNQGALPLRNFKITTEPDWCRNDISFLPEKERTTIQVSGIAPKITGSFTLHLSWSALTLDGQRINGEREIAFNIVGEVEGLAEKLDALGGSPYVCGDPVRPERSDVFFGREDLLEQIRRQIIQSGNVVLLEGNRRSGKSSVLWHLEGVNAVPGWLGVYCSLQGAEGSKDGVGVPTVEVFREMAICIAKSLRNLGGETPLPDGSALPRGQRLGIAKACRGGISEESPFSDFRDYVEITLERLGGYDLNLLIMLDEFDKLQEGIDSGVTSPQVPENIRFLVQTYPRFSAILTGSRRLKRLREEYWSALYGLGTRFGVTSLPEEPARLLVTEPVKGCLTFAREAASRAIYLTAGQPYLLQCLCNRIFDIAAQLKTHSVTLDLVDQASDALVEDNEHFASLWDYAWSDQRRFILYLCHKEVSGPDSLRLGVIQERLITYGIEVDDDSLITDLEFLRELELIDLIGDASGGHYILSIPLMGTWIERQQDFEAVLSKARSETEDQYD